MVFAITTSICARPQPFMEAGTSQPPPLFPAPKPATTETNGAGANTNAVSPPATRPLDFFGVQIPDAIARGKFNLNVRIRNEWVDEGGVPAIIKNSDAPTIRTRFGYTTAPLYGLQGMLEGVNVTAIGPENNYNAAGANGQGARPVVADPRLTRLDQAWLGWSYSNYFSGKVGEQHINLDNQRFVGDVAWRQNMQTYDAAQAQGSPLKGLDLYYAYVWDVHRVFGNVAGLPVANQDFSSRSHFINVAYSPCQYVRLAGYAYLLDLGNAAGDGNSCATYGGYLAGAAPVIGELSLDYRAEFAWQRQYADSPLRYHADYYNFELGARWEPLAAGVGYEDLGSGDNEGAGGGRASFRTPLATLHAFNGWADVFLTTPANGLRDAYAYAQVTLPGKVPLRFVYHKFDADFGGGDFGQEFDAVVSKKFGKYWTALVKFADYRGENTPAPSLPSPNVNLEKIWAQLEFNF
jgi:hypothetical protein